MGILVSCITMSIIGLGWGAKGCLTYCGCAIETHSSTNKMDVDQNVPTGSKHLPSASASPKKRVKTIPPARLTVVNGNMNKLSNAQMWQARSKKAGDDDALWGELAKDVLMHTSHLDIDYNMIVPQTLEGAERLVKRFKKAEFEQWKAGVRTGVERKDWSDLIAHRMYISDYWGVISHLILTTAILQRPEIPDSPSGVPIQLRKQIHNLFTLPYYSQSHFISLSEHGTSMLRVLSCRLD